MAGELPPELQVADVAFRYRRSRANALDVNITLRSGRTIVLGPNGAGKSTLFGLCANRLRLQQGSIALHIEGATAQSSGKIFRSHVGFMAQNPTFIGSLPAKDHLAYAAWLSGLSGSAVLNAAEEWLEHVHLTAHAEKACKELSGGMQRRLAFAAASINLPSLLLLDEPTAGLDPLERGAFRDILTSLHRDAVVVIATHQIDDIDLVADWIIVLSAGKVVFHDTVAAFLDHADPALPQLARAELAYKSVIRHGLGD